MKVILESTDKIVSLETAAGAVPARIWEGQTDSGVPVHAYITRVAVPTNLPAAAHEQFKRELAEQRAPSMGVAAIPLRLVL